MQKRLETIFNGAIGKTSEAEQAAYLDGACHGDAELRVQVEQLLADYKEGEFLEKRLSPDMAVTALDSDPSPLLHSMIGPYKLLQVIGEGGMGTVYMADQRKPVERRVAIKIIKAGMDSKQVIARFAAEQQALALMDHPNIAKVLDAGTTETGRPYFVMELVKGIPITKYCDEKQLNLRERLRLIVDVCNAIQHAHQKGIIHRDIKPSNVLVTQYDGKPVPKVIDFGVAKAIAQRLTEKTMFTEFGVVIGTLEYMSPEQAELNQLDVDTRSDVYSIGVLLYELLTGSTPLDGTKLRSVAFNEMLRMIREDEPQKPSTKISSSQALPSIAACRQIEPLRLTKQVRGELDWIAMKALEKDRGRRYSTASEFAEDINRFLANEAVLASPPSTFYRFRKFAHRNRVLISTLGIIGATLVVGLVGTSWQAIRAIEAEKLADSRLAKETESRKSADAERERADRETERARAEKANAEREATTSKAISDFLLNDLLAQIDISNQLESKLAPDPDIKVRTLLDRASAKIGEQFAGIPEIEGSIRHTIGEAYHSLGLFEQAEPHFRRAVEIGRDEIGADHPGTLRAIGALANLYRERGRLTEAEPLLKERLELSRRLLGDSNEDTIKAMFGLVVMYFDQNRFREASVLAEECMGICRQKFGPNHQLTLHAMSNAASQWMSLNRKAEAEKLNEEVLKIRVATLGENHPDTLTSMRTKATSHFSNERYLEAEILFKRVIKLAGQFRQADHPDIIRDQANLGRVLHLQGKSEEAESILNPALQNAKQFWGEEYTTTHLIMMSLLEIYVSRNRLDEAFELSARLNEIGLKLLGPKSAKNARTKFAFAELLAKAGKHDEAEQKYLEAIADAREVGDFDRNEMLTFLNNLGVFYQSRQRLDEAESIFKQVIESKLELFGPGSPNTSCTTINLAYIYVEQGKLSEAYSMLENAIAVLDQLVGKDHSDSLRLREKIADFYRPNRKIPDRNVRAEVLYRQIAESRERTLGIVDPSTLAMIKNVADMLFLQKRAEEASALLESVVRKCVDSTHDASPEVLQAHEIAGLSYRLGDKQTEALDHLKQVYTARVSSLGHHHADTDRVFKPLLSCYRGLKQYPEAIKLLRELVVAIQLSPDAKTSDRIQGLLDLADLLAEEEKASSEIKLNSEAERLYLDALNLSADSEKGEALIRRQIQVNLSEYYVNQRRYQEAEELQRKAVSYSKRVNGLTAFITLSNMQKLGDILAEQEKFEEAIELGDLVVTGREQANGATNLGAILSRMGQCRVLLAKGDWDSAEQNCLQTFKLQREQEDASGLLAGSALGAHRILATVYQLQGRSEDAINVLQQSINRWLAVGPKANPKYVLDEIALAHLYLKQEKLNEAEAVLIELVNVFQGEFVDKVFHEPKLLYAQSLHYIQSKRFVEAQSTLEKLLKIHETTKQREWPRFAAMSMLGECLSLKGQNDEAEELMLNGMTGLQNHLRLMTMDQKSRALEFQYAAERLVRHYQRVANEAAVKHWKLEREKWKLVVE